MTRILIAGLLALAGLATVSVPHAEAAACQIDYRYIEDAGASVHCYIPYTDYDCYARGPGHWDPVPTVRCLGVVDFPPTMPEMCRITMVPIGSSYPDVQVACTTENYVEGPVCRTWLDTTAPQDTSASC